MKPTTLIRVLSDKYPVRDPRQIYRNARQTAVRLGGLVRTGNVDFLCRAAKDQIKFVFNAVEPVAGQTMQRARAAAEWLLRAKEGAGDGGVSYGYFPSDPHSGWRLSYPETTGYIIPTLIEYAELSDNPVYLHTALDMARWEVTIQMKCGAVQGGMVCRPEEQTPAAFNTGMVLEGWSAAYRASGETQFLRAAQRAAAFLLGDLDKEGYFRSNGFFVSGNRIKTYNVLCASALYRHGQDTQNDACLQAAVRIGEGALRQQQPNGWFTNNSFSDSEMPLVHTIGYALQGLLEVGILAGRRDFILAVRGGIDPLLQRISPDGFLHNSYYPDWEPAGFSCCLAGSAQVAVVSYRLYEVSRERKYREAADRILNFLKGLQVLGSGNSCINGAIAGSFPLFGSYMTFGYPNWATKYFLDGLILQHRLSLQDARENRRSLDCSCAWGPNRNEVDLVAECVNRSCSSPADQGQLTEHVQTTPALLQLKERSAMGFADCQGSQIHKTQDLGTNTCFQQVTQTFQLRIGLSVPNRKQNR